ncbi:MAG: phasin family protein [Rubricoccaceae bacterium]|nr:phasin family protein [Rubricoccaceae bacterium]
MATTTVQSELKKTTDDAVKLAKTTADTVQKTVTDTANGVKETTERIFFAGLGAFALAEEEGTKFFDKLVTRGRKVELPELPEIATTPLTQIRKGIDEGAEAVTGRAKDARYMAGEAAEKAEDRLQETVAGVMKRLGVPSKEEIDALTASVERLNKRLDALKKERAKKPEVAFTMEAVGGGWYEIAVDGVVVEKVQGKEEAEAALARLAEQKA